MIQAGKPGQPFKLARALPVVDALPNDRSHGMFSRTWPGWLERQDNHREAERAEEEGVSSCQWLSRFPCFPGELISFSADLPFCPKLDIYRYTRSNYSGFSRLTRQDMYRGYEARVIREAAMMKETDMSHSFLRLDRKIGRHEQDDAAAATKVRSRRVYVACFFLIYARVFPCSVQLFLFWQSAPGRDRDVFVLKQGPRCYTTYQILRDLRVPIQLRGDLGLLVFINLRLHIAREILVYILDHIHSL